MSVAGLDVPRKEPIGLIAVMASASMLFAAFTAAYLLRRTGTDWKPVRLPSLVYWNTLLLIASSVFLELGRRRTRGTWYQASVITGGLFLVGQLLAWRDLAARGWGLADNPHSAFFYVLTAVHGLHLVGGLIALSYAWVKRRHLVECAVFWHFMGVMWIYLLAVLEVLG